MPDGFDDVLVTGSLDFPVGFAFIPDGRVLVVEQKSTRIRLLVNGALAATDPVATLPNIQTGGGEQGLLGIAVDPGWPSRPYLYVHCDNSPASTIRISRYTVGGDLSFTGNGSLTVDPASRYDLLNDAPDLAPNHNGGTLRFGLDGMLYASLGEDAASCAAQDLVSLRGVILRLDVSRLPAGPGVATRALITPADNPFVGSANANTRLVWALGLRNPFRFQVDSFDGSLWVGDVGESAYEEVDHVAAGGHNFGWPAYEAMAPHSNSCSGVVRGDDPVYFYSRAGTQAAVIGAGTYRRPAGALTGFPLEYEGNLFASDYYIGFLRRLVPNGASWGIAPPVAGQPAPANWGQGFSNVSDWAVGPDGALWYCRQSDAAYHAGTGAIRRIEPIGSAGTPPPRDAQVEFRAPYPSPAPGVVHFAWVLPRVEHVELTLHDVGGRLVRELVPRELESTGPHGITWPGTDDDGRAVRPGIYIVRLVADGRVHERRFPLLR